MAGENPFVKSGCKGMIEIMKGNVIMLRIDLPGNDLEFTKEGGRLMLTATEDNDVDFPAHIVSRLSTTRPIKKLTLSAAAAPTV